MRISPTPGVCSGLLCGYLMLLAGCGSPSSQTLDSLSVTASPSVLSIGGASVLKAVAHLSDGTTQDVTANTAWTLSNPALATMSSNAVTAKAAGTLAVQAAYFETAPAGTSPASASVTPQNLSSSAQITITSSPSTNTPLISWNTPAPVTYGTPLSNTQLSATANLAGTFTYSPSAGTVLGAGTQTLSVTFTPTNQTTYSSATASVQLTVNQASAAITWPAPAPVAAGSTLGPAQLDATANVPGAFMYSPAAGTVLTAGAQRLTAVFSPTDAADYSSVTSYTSLIVNAPSSVPGAGPTGPSPQPLTGCGGPTIDLNSSMSESTIRNAISGAPPCALIVFAAGAYGPITSTITIPCGVSLSGPTVPYSQTPNQTATIHGSSSFIGWGFQTTAGCGVPQTIAYLEWNGEQPSATCTAGYCGGGGFLDIVPGTTNLVIENNWLHGVNAPNADNGGTSNSQADLIYFSGGASGVVTSGITIQYNIAGSTGLSDCGGAGSSGAMQEMNSETNAGLCGFVGIHNNVQNVSILYNIAHWLEEPIKFFEAQGQCNPVIVSYNSISNYSRIGYETQCDIGTSSQPTNMTIDYNVFGTRYGAQQNYDLSAANGTGNSYGSYGMTHSDYNVDLQPALGAADVGLEIWGQSPSGCALNCTTANYNLLQGYLYDAITWSQGGNFQFDNNTFNIVNNGTNQNCAAGAGGFWDEETSNSPAYTPTCAGNSFSNDITGTYASAAPTMTPGGSFSGSQVVTVSNPGADRDTNTTDWCTTDGSMPTPGSGTAIPYYNGGNLTVTTTTTVKCVGMWGALNQPYSYPSGFGYVPSAMASSTFTAAVAPAVRKAGSPKSTGRVVSGLGLKPGPAAMPPAAVATLQSVTITPAQAVVAIGATTQLKAIATFQDGSTRDISTQFAWTSSDPRTISAGSSGLLSGLAGGEATISGSYQGLQTSASAASSIGEVNWSGPIVITEGGAYSGNWQSTSVSNPAVTVATTAPVVIENAHIRGAGSLIVSSVPGVDLTVRNSLGVAMNSPVKGQPNGVFLEVQSPTRLDVENNYIESARGGVLVHGYAGNRDGKQTIVIRANRARNLNGLLSNGQGGYLSPTGGNRRAAQFIQLDTVQAVPGIDVGWNEVINYPGHSLVQDNIDIQSSSGTPNSPIEIHDTYIQGAYPDNPAQDPYTGGGIKTDAKSGATARDVPAFNSIHDNQVVATVNYGIQFAAGHDNVAYNNRVLSSGTLANGARIQAQNAGLENGNAAAVAAGSMYNNTMRDNLVGWACWNPSCASEGYRRDQYFPASPADYSANSVFPDGQITPDTENNEYLLWMIKTAASGVAVGPAF